jgi:hypothetical protein
MNDYYTSTECGHDLNVARWEAQYDAEAAEWAYEEACHAVGVLPYGGWGRENDGEYAYDQPETVGR